MIFSADPYPVITSSENSTFKSLQKAVAGGSLKKQGRTVVAGAKLVDEALRLMPGHCRRLIVPEGFTQAPELVREFGRRRAIAVLKKGLFNRLDVFNTGFALLELAVPLIPEWNGTLDMPGCTLALPFQDPANVGSAVRSACAFGATRIVLLREAAHPFHPKSIRASGGGAFSAKFFRGPALAQLDALLPHPAPPVITLDMRGTPLFQFSFPESFLLVPGMEGQGLPAGLRARSVAIPMSGAVESLNAATATSIALFYWSAGQLRR